MNRPAHQDTPSSLTRGLKLLELFSPQESELSIGEMSRRSGTPKSTTHRLVQDLIQWGALERGRRGVRLGVRLFELGNLVPDHARLRELAIPFAHTLNTITRLTSNIAVREGSEIIYIEKIRSGDLRVPHSRVGGRLPMHCTALGKTILAFSTDEFVDSVLSEPLARLAPMTITEPTRLRAELREVRRTRVAYDLEESQEGLFCVAAPILGHAGRALGAISVTGASSRSQARSFSDAVSASAHAITHALKRRSGRPKPPAGTEIR